MRARRDRRDPGTVAAPRVAAQASRGRRAHAGQRPAGRRVRRAVGARWSSCGCGSRSPAPERDARRRTRLGCSPRPCCPAPSDQSTERDRRRAAGGRRRAVGSTSTPTGCSSRHRAGAGPARLLELLGRGAHRRGLPDERSAASATGWPTGIAIAAASPPHAGPRGAAARGCTASTRTRCETPAAGRASRRSTAGRAARAARRTGRSRPAARWCIVGDTRAGAARWTRSRRRSRGGRGRAAGGDAAACRSDRPAGRAARRPARFGAVLIRLGAAGAAAHARRLRGAAAGQPGLRRLLLLAAGREHPRGQGLHVLAAQLRSSTRRPARGSSWTPDVATEVTAPALLEIALRARPDRRRCRSARTSWSGPAVRARHARAVDRDPGGAGRHALGAGRVSASASDWLAEHPLRLARRRRARRSPRPRRVSAPAERGHRACSATRPSSPTRSSAQAADVRVD